MPVAPKPVAPGSGPDAPDAPEAPDAPASTQALADSAPPPRRRCRRRRRSSASPGSARMRRRCRRSAPSRPSRPRPVVSNRSSRDCARARPDSGADAGASRAGRASAPMSRTSRADTGEPSTRRRCARSFLRPLGVAGRGRVAGVPALVAHRRAGCWRSSRLAKARSSRGDWPAVRRACSGTNGTLKVESKPMGAQVKIDGEVKGVTPLSLSLAGGAHVMEIAAGAEPRVIPITVTRRADARAVRRAGGRLRARPPVDSVVARRCDGAARRPAARRDAARAPRRGGRRPRARARSQGPARSGRRVSVATGITTTVNLPMNAGRAGRSMPPACCRRRRRPPGMVLVQVPFEMQVFEGEHAARRERQPPVAAAGPARARSRQRDAVVPRAGHASRSSPARRAASRSRCPKGTVHLNATPWAEVWVDGEKVGDTPMGNLRADHRAARDRLQAP